MSGFIPEGYITLREAIDLAGRREFGSEWTGDELDAEYNWSSPSESWNRCVAVERTLAQALHAGRLAAVYVNTWSGELIALKARWWLSDEGGKALRRRRDDRDRPILLTRASLEVWLGIADAPPAPAPSAVVVTYETGLSGRQTSKHLIMAEFERRRDAYELAGTLGDEATYLAEWLRRTHPAAAPAVTGTIENHIRGAFRQAQNRPQK
jgi:hypothetical protein